MFWFDKNNAYCVTKYALGEKMDINYSSSNETQIEKKIDI